MQRSLRGIAALLFAILLQLCSSGMEFISLAIGFVGLIMVAFGDIKSK